MRLGFIVAVFTGIAVMSAQVVFAQSDKEISTEIGETAYLNSLDRRISEFKATFEQNQVGELVNYMPPKLRDAFTRQYNMPIPQLKVALQQYWEQTLQKVSVESYDMIRPGELVTLANGRKYAFIETITVMRMKTYPNQLIESQSETLALLDNETWYLVRLQGPEQLGLFKSAYPEFQNVEFALATTQPK